MMKLTLLVSALFLAATRSDAASDAMLKDRPAEILSIDRAKGFARFRIAAKRRVASAKPREAELMITYKDWSAQVVRLIPPNRKRPATLDELKPGMNVLVTGVNAISSNYVSEIAIDERKTRK